MIKKLCTYLLTASILASTVFTPLQTYAADFEPESKIELNESTEELLNEEEGEVDSTEALDDEEIVEDIDVSENDENEIIPDNFSEEEVEEVIGSSDEEEIVEEEILDIDEEIVEEEIIVYEEQSLETEFDGKTISVNGNLPIGTEIKVSYVNTEEITENLKEGEVLAFAYDISLWFNDEEIEPDDTVTVSISGIEEELENMGIDIEDIETLKITHIADNGTEEIVFEENEVIDDVTFETDSFSIYTAVVTPNQSDAPTSVGATISVCTAITGEKLPSERQVAAVNLTLSYVLPRIGSAFEVTIQPLFNDFTYINPSFTCTFSKSIPVYSPISSSIQSSLIVENEPAILKKVKVNSAYATDGSRLTAEEFEELYNIQFYSQAAANAVKTDLIVLIPTNRTIATYNGQEHKLYDSFITVQAGKNITGYWFEGEGLLMFTGFGEMASNANGQYYVAENCKWNISIPSISDYNCSTERSGTYVGTLDSSAELPWEEIKNDITSIYIDPRITSIPDDFLSNCPNLRNVEWNFGDIQSIGENAFANCSMLSLDDEEIPASVQSIGANAFTGSNIVFKRNASAVEITEEMGVQTTFTVIDKDEDGNELGREEFVGTVGSDVTTDVATAEYEGYSLAQVNTRSLAVTGLNDDEGINVIVPQNSGTVTIGASDSDRLELVRTFALTPDSEKVFEYNGKEYFDTEATTTYAAGDNITAYWYESDGVLGFVGTGDMYDYNEIPWRWDSIRDNITNVYLSDEITYIGTLAFWGCTNLALTELPSGLTTIGERAFHNCYNLALTELPASLTTIGNGAFNSCANLALTELPSGLTSIGNSAFSECTNLALTELPSGLTSIGNSAFYDCTNLALSGELPSGLTSIGEIAFCDCTNLALSGSLPSGLTTIGNSAFIRCYKLALTGDIPENITSIGRNIFCDVDPEKTHFDKNLSSVSITPKMYIPTAYTFVDTFTDGKKADVTTTKYGFVGATSSAGTAPTYEGYTLKTDCTNGIITIGSTDEDRFTLTREYEPTRILLTTYKGKDYYKADATNTWSLQNGFTAYWFESDGFLYFDGTGEMPAFGIESRPWHGLNVTDVKFNDNITYIGSQLVHGFTTLTDVVLPASLREIGLGAFAGCTNLENMTELNEGLEEIGYFAFLNCKKLELTQDLPSTLKKIRQEAFSHSGVAFTGSLPSGLEDIGFNAFEGCKNLNLSGDIPESVTNIGGGAFNGCLNSCFERNLSDYDITSLHTVPTRFTVVDLDDADSTELGRKDYVGYVGYEYKATVSDTEYEHYTLSDAKDKGNLVIDKVGTHTVLYRYWTADTYTITFEDYDGREISKQSYTYGATVDVPANPKRDGYTFRTWSPAIEKVTGGRTYKAVYSKNGYTIKFIADGKELVNKVYYYGDAVSIPVVPEKAGYVFKGWDKPINARCEENVTYTAVFEKEVPTPATYTIKFKDYDGELISLKTYTEGDTIKVPSDPTRSGYEFDGWSPEVSETADADATYKATYTKKEPLVTPETIKPDVTPTTPLPTTPVTPTPEVKEETKPKTPVEDEVEEDEEDDEPEEIKVVIPDKSDNEPPKTVEVPKKTYKITFVDDNGNVISAKYYKEGDAVSVPDAPEKENFEFTNWSPAFSNKAISDAEYKPIYKEVKKEEPVAPAPEPPVEKPKTPIQKAVPAIVAGVVTTGILATGYFSGLWLFLANLLFVKRRKKWHGLLNLEENGFVKNILDETEDDVYIEDVWAKSNGNC